MCNMTFPHYARVLIGPGSDKHRPPQPVSVTSPPQVRYPYAGRSRVAQSAERPAVNRQVIGSSPIAGAVSSALSPATTQEERESSWRTKRPHGARSPQNPTTGAQRGRTVLRRSGEGWPHGTRQGPREWDRTRGHPGRRAGDRAGSTGSRCTRPARSRVAGGRSATRVSWAGCGPAPVAGDPGGHLLRKDPAGALAAAATRSSQIFALRSR